MLRRYGLLLFIVVCGGILLGWNGSRFIGAKPKIRAKNLAFLPSPIIARALSLGQANTVAKLRWIDSFAYFQYQLGRTDDSAPGQDTRGGFYRLYDTLTSLDPYFEPYYEHATLNLSGLLGRHQQALEFLMRGLMARPHDTVLWRNAAATLASFYQWEEKQPQSFHAFLTAWADAELTADDKRMVFDWQRAMGNRLFKGLEQLPYWFDRLRSTTPKTPMAEYVEETIRTQLAMYGEQELTALALLYRRTSPPSLAAAIADLSHRDLALADLLRLGRMPLDVAELGHPRLVRQRYPRGLPGYAPLRVRPDGVVELRQDPYGRPWRIEGVAVKSPGLAYQIYEKSLYRVQQDIEDHAKAKGSWPTTLAEVRSWGVAIPEPPEGGTLRLVEHQIAVDWPQPTAEPWRLR